MNLFSKQNIKSFFGSLAVFNITFVSALFTIFSETRDSIVELIISYVPVAKRVGEVLLVLGLNIVMIIIWILLYGIKLKRSHASLKISIDDDSRGERISDFQALRKNAKKNIMIMGIGMSSVSKDNDIENLLKKGININVLIMAPEILVDSPLSKEELPNKNILIDNQKFSSFYSKNNYKEIIEKSISDFRKIADDQKERYNNCNGCWNEGMIDVRKYFYYIPMNVTISDMDEKDPTKSKLVAEFCLPFSAKRIRTKLSHGEVKELIQSQILELWENAEKIIDYKENKI